MFRKRKYSVMCDEPARPIYEIQQHVEPNNGVTYERVDVTSDKYKASLPNRSDYTLENLSRAGVPLKQVQTHGMMSATDPAIADQIMDFFDKNNVITPKDVASANSVPDSNDNTSK